MGLYRGPSCITPRSPECRIAETILHVELVLRVPFAGQWTLLLLEVKILPPLQGTANSATNCKERSSRGNLALPVWLD